MPSSRMLLQSSNPCSDLSPWLEGCQELQKPAIASVQFMAQEGVQGNVELLLSLSPSPPSVA